MTKVNGARVSDNLTDSGGIESESSEFSGKTQSVGEKIEGNVVHVGEEVGEERFSDANCDELTYDELPLDDLEEESVNHGNHNSISTIKLDVHKLEELKNDGVIKPADEHCSDSQSESESTSDEIDGQHVKMIRPHEMLPKPEPPRGFFISSSPVRDDASYANRSQSLKENFVSVDMPALGKYIRERGNSFSAAIAKHINSFKEIDDPKLNVTEFNLSGLKVIVKQKNDSNVETRDEKAALKGRISFFSRSNCRDCTAVRTFFREKGLKFVEINVDVYPTREKELIERAGSSSVPQIFFNEKLFGGLVVLNSLRNSGGFDERLKEMLKTKCPDDAPAPPVYGFDDPEEEEEDNKQDDELVDIVRVLRQRLPIQDRLMKMKIVKNCFAGAEMVEVVIHHLNCGRRKAVEIGTKLARKHFIHHVFGDKDFMDGNHYFYRFLEHEPFIPKCFNFRGTINESDPKPLAKLGQRLAKIMLAILESYASEDRRHIDYMGISNSEEFRRYVNLVQDLHRVDISELSHDEKLAFFLNLYNAMVIHAVIRIGRPEGVIDRRAFTTEFQYIVGGAPYSLSTIKNGILRSNQRPPYSLTKPFGSGDKRVELALPQVNPLIHFALCNGTRSSPAVRFYSPQGIEAALRCAARDFFKKDGLEVDLEKRTVYLTRAIKWFGADFGEEKKILKYWIMNYLDSTKAGLLTHLLSDGGAIRIVYQDYDWSVNS